MSRGPADAIAQVRKLYFNATEKTIQRDLTRAVELLKGMASDDERQRAAVYMDGLSQMRSEWAASRASGARKRTAPRDKTSTKRSRRAT